jgi:hypothetical protein
MDDIIQIAEIEICGQKYPLTMTMSKIIGMLSKKATKGAKIAIITILLNDLLQDESDVMKLELRKIKEMIS